MGKGKRNRKRRQASLAPLSETTTKPRLAIRPWIPPAGNPCPCGSGLAYAHCCAPLLDGKESRAGLWREAEAFLSNGDVQAAEKVFRANFVQYLRWVFEHTVPILNKDASFVKQLVRIDIDALQSLADSVAQCMFKLGRATQIIPFLDHVRSVVPLQEFAARATYLKAAWLYLGLNDRQSARAELTTLGDILQTDHRQTMELYLDVFGDVLSPRQKIALSDAILAQAKDESHIRVQYSTVKAVALVMIGEPTEAIRLLETVTTDSLIQQALEDREDSHLAFVVAHALSFRAKTSATSTQYEQAERLLRSIDNDRLTRAGQAMLLLELGRIQFDRKEYHQAAESCSRSRDLDPSVTTDIHLAHAYALAGSSNAARHIIGGLEQHRVDPILELERLAAIVAVAIADGDVPLASEVVRRLRAIAEESPFWAGQRDHLIIEVMDFIARPKAIPVVERQNRVVATIASINQVLELKPNVFGIGINFNRMIEKMIEKLTRGTDKE